MSALQEMSEPLSDAESIAEMLEKTIHFPLGLPGFHDEKRFVLNQTEQERPFAWLRSLDQPLLAFAVIEAYRLVPDYTVEIPDEELVPIGSPSPQECSILLILRIMVEDTVKIYANLKAPIILNTINHEARQIILFEADHYSESTLFEFGVKK